MKGETVSAREAFHKKFQIPSEFPKNSKTKPFKSITEPCTNLNTPEEIKLLIEHVKKESHLVLADPTKFELKSAAFLNELPDVIKILDISNNPFIRFNYGSNLTKLKYLSLEKCGLVEFSVKNLAFLVSLDLSHNRLQVVPDLSGYVELENLNLSGNSFTSGFHLIPKQKLKVLDLSSCKIDLSISELRQHLFSHLKPITSLNYFSICSNPIEKKIDAFRLFVLEELAHIKVLDWVNVTKEERVTAKNWDHQQWAGDKSNLATKKPLTKVTNLSGTSKQNLASGLRPGLLKAAVSEKKKTEEEEEAERLEKLIEEKLNGINLDNDYVLSSSEDDKADANPQPERNHVTEGASVGFGAETFVRNNLDSLLDELETKPATQPEEKPEFEMTEAEKEAEVQRIILQLEEEEREQRRQAREQQEREQQEQQQVIQEEGAKQEAETKQEEPLMSKEATQPQETKVVAATEQPKATGWKRQNANSEKPVLTRPPSSRNLFHNKIATENKTTENKTAENQNQEQTAPKAVIEENVPSTIVAEKPNEEPKLSKFEKMKLEQQKQEEYQKFQQELLIKSQNLEHVPERQPEPEPEPEPEPQAPKKVTFVPQALEFIDKGMDDDEIEKLNTVLARILKMIAKGSLAAEQLKAFGFISKTITTPARILHLSYSDEFFSSVAAIIERMGELGQFDIASAAMESVVSLSASSYRMASRFGQAGVLAPLMSFFCVINNDHINGTIVTGTAIISLLTSHPENVSVFSKIVDWKVLKGLLDKRRADVLLVTIKILSILLRIRDNRKKLLKISGGFESLNQHLTTNNVPQRLAMMELMCNFYYEKGPVIEVVKGLDLENKVVRMASSNNEALVVSSHNCILNYSFSTTTVNKMSSTMLKSFATICLQKITNSLAEVESNAVQLKVVLSALTNFVANNHSIMLKLVHPQLKDILALIDSESLRPTCFSLLLELVKQGSIKSKDSLRIWKVLKGYFKSIIETERIFSFQILNEIEKKAPLALKQPTDEQSHFFTALASSIAFSYMNLFEMQAALVLLEQILAPLNARSSPDIDFEKSYTIICYSGITNALVMCIDEALRNEELYQLVNQLLGRILVQITEYQVACELITASPQVELVFVFLKKLDAQFNEDVEIKVKNNIVKERS